MCIDELTLAVSRVGIRTFSQLLRSRVSAQTPRVCVYMNSHLFTPSGIEVHAYSIATGALVFSLVGHHAEVTGVVQHPTNCKQIVTGSLDGTIRCWDADDGSLLRVVSVGAPVVRLASPDLWPLNSPPRVYAVVLSSPLSSHAVSPREPVDYPVGDEVACLRPRPLGSSFAATVDPMGFRREPPKCVVCEVYLAASAAGPTARVIFAKNGFVSGLSALCLGSRTTASGLSSRDAQQQQQQQQHKSAGGVGNGSIAVVENGSSAAADAAVPDVAVAFTIRRKLFIWRSGLDSGSSLTLYLHSELLTTVRRKRRSWLGYENMTSFAVVSCVHVPAC